MAKSKVSKDMQDVLDHIVGPLPTDGEQLQWLASLIPAQFGNPGYIRLTWWMNCLWGQASDGGWYLICCLDRTPYCPFIP